MTQQDRLVVDASVAMKWYVPEQHSMQATAVLASGFSLIAPDLVISEFGNTLWKKVRSGELR